MEEAEASHDPQMLMKLNYAQELNPFEYARKIYSLFGWF
jgi:hypothetical protein